MQKLNNIKTKIKSTLTSESKIANTKLKRSNSQELMYLFDKYQEIMTYFDSTDDANRLIKQWQSRYKNATLNWIYNKILFDLKWERKHKH